MLCVGSLVLASALPLRAAGEAESGGGQHVVTIGGERIDLALPEGLCPVDPARGGNHAALWQRFTPPPQRQARLLALAIDCPTLRTVETGGLRRPRSLAHLVDSPPDPRLPASLAGALEALERRFSRPELAAKAPVLGRDGLAVYVEQRGGGGEGTARMSGVSAFTARRGQPFIANVFHFGEPPPLAGIRDQARRMVRSLHDLAP